MVKKIIPNLLSLTRMVLLVPTLYCLDRNTPEGNWIAILLLMLAGITDGLDGFLARKWSIVSRKGKILDPVADKILAGGLVIYLLLTRDFPLWYGAIIIGRDGAILLANILILAKIDMVFVSNKLGKLTYTVIFLSIVTFIIESKLLQSILVPAGAVLIVASTIYYGIEVIKNLKRAGQ